MKITIKSDAVLDGIYAETSLRTIAAAAPVGYVSRFLTRSQGPALRRLLDDAVAIALARLGTGWRLVSPAGNQTINLDSPDDLLLDSETAATLISAALVRLCVAVIHGAGSSGRDTAHREVAGIMLDTVARRRVKLCSTEPCGL
ncbi:MAG: hypothetical protein K2M00_03280 [Muribaculaceae bacterium]|nr:hypothetical protein [Muribaculaceae bacterium]